VLDQQPSNIKSFLLDSCVLGRLCAPLCDAVMERNDSQDMLEQLERANLFISPLDDERRWYRYHQLFSTVLNNRMTRINPDRASLLRRRVIGWYDK